MTYIEALQTQLNVVPDEDHPNEDEDEPNNNLDQSKMSSKSVKH